MSNGTVVDEATQRTLTWARAMQEWLMQYGDHVDQLCEDKQLPKPPRW